MLGEQKEGGLTVVKRWARSQDWENQRKPRDAEHGKAELQPLSRDGTSHATNLPKRLNAAFAEVMSWYKR